MGIILTVNQRPSDQGTWGPHEWQALQKSKLILAQTNSEKFSRELSACYADHSTKQRKQSAPKGKHLLLRILHTRYHRDTQLKYPGKKHRSRRRHGDGTDGLAVNRTCANPHNQPHFWLTFKFTLQTPQILTLVKSSLTKNVTLPPETETQRPQSSYGAMRTLLNATCCTHCESEFRLRLSKSESMIQTHCC